MAFGALALAVVLVACDRDRGAAGDPPQTETGYEIPGRGTRAFDVRSPAGEDTQKVVITGPGGAIPGGTRTTDGSIPSAGDTNFPPY